MLVRVDRFGIELTGEGMDLRDCRSFVRDWNALRQQWMRWVSKHPLTRFEDWLWEREKNAWRRWWFQHTRGERQYMLDQRNVTEARIFQPKYGHRRFQRGNFAMFPAGTTGGPLGPTVTLTNANTSATNIEISPPTALTAGFYFYNQTSLYGELWRQNSSGNNQINNATDWVVPQTQDNCNLWDFRWNQPLGININQPLPTTENTWVGFDTQGTCRIRHSTSGIATIKTVTVDIRDEVSLSVVATRNYSIEAGNLL